MALDIVVMGVMVSVHGGDGEAGKRKLKVVVWDMG